MYIDDGRPNLKDIKETVDGKIIELIEMNWNWDPEKRMTFRNIIPILENLLKIASESPSYINQWLIK